MDELIKPIIDNGLLDYLQRLFPDKCPELNQTDREVWMNRGAAGVVRHLSLLHKDQHETILGDRDVYEQP